MMYDTPHHSIPQFAQNSPMDFSMGDNSQHRSEQAQDALPDAQWRTAVMLRHLPALIKGFFKITPHILQCIAAVEYHVVFKMQVKAPVIQVGRADGSNGIIHQALLAVAEAGTVLKDPHSLRHQPA